jgi:Family of unknown function (DUF6079)
LKYSDLVQFDPIQSVKVLRDAEDAARAATDVKTFVISRRMADQLAGVILPNLRFDALSDAKGLLVVANYGTGKTHLMSVITAVCEDTKLLPLLTNATVAVEFKPIAGRFRVIRAEIGAVRMGLRDIVCTDLEHGLKKLGITFKFPSADTITNNKDALKDMMAAFEAVYPDQGLLFALDELLDFLRKRKDAELIEDLQFLREVGEVSSTIRFRFMAGVQEALFDNPRFANVASDMNRVKDRFVQVRISREDVAYVIQERLLRKTTAQRDLIREHLQPFAPLYGGMAEGMEEYVSLFPVHPAFIRTFERISAIEKREILKTLTEEMQPLLNKDVPDDTTGLICYDSYRARMSDDPAVRSLPEVREVLDKSEVLRSRIEKAMPTKAYIPVAKRVIDGLAVHRLTTEDIYTPIGATTQELCTDLCLLPANLPERDATFLELAVAAVIDEIVKAVSGQFITENRENGQVYLDLRKDIDYDQKIEDRAASLDDRRLDEAYFAALEEVLERRDLPYVSGYRIWEYELPWAEKNVTRFGYLFMGAPNERSTAQPPRDFYIYFLQPYDPPKFVDGEKEDEVFLRLESPGVEFTEALKHYAGASAMARETTATHRTIYEDKAAQSLRQMVVWLKANMATAVSLTYRGDTRPVSGWLATTVGPRATVKEQIDGISAAALSSHFQSRYPGYPKFGVAITRGNLWESVQLALSQIATGRSTKTSSALMESLALVDVSGSLTPTGRYAEQMLKDVSGGSGKVVNRSQLLVEVDPGVPTWGPWHLEPAWAVVVAAALTQLGKLEIGFSSGQIDALSLDRLTKMPAAELDNFSFLAPPKALPVVQLREVAILLGLPAASIKNSGADEAVVVHLLNVSAERLNHLTEARDAVRTGLTLWGAPVIEQPDQREQRLEALQALLQDVKNRNTVGKMNKLQVSDQALKAAKAGMEELKFVQAANSARNKLLDVATYLQDASGVFGSNFDLSEDAARLRTEMLDIFRSGQVEDVSHISQLRLAADQLKTRFIQATVKALNHDTLDATADERKRKLLEGDRYRDIKQLAAVSLLPGGVFASLEKQLVELPVIKYWDEKDLEKSVRLPDSNYLPGPITGPSAATRLGDIEIKLEQLRKNWIETLVENMKVPELEKAVDLLPTGQRATVKAFLHTGELHSPVSDDFVRALNDALGGFVVRRVTRNQVWGALFPNDAPATLNELRSQFAGLVSELATGAAEEKVRIIPDTDNGTDGE